MNIRGLNIPCRPGPVSRRGFLRGAGAALALPWLESVGHAAAKPPVRMAALYFPNGAAMKDWVPQSTGYDYTLPFSLRPLAPLQEHVTVLSGLDKANSRMGDGHYAKTANFLTGLPVAKTTGREISVGGVSLDQLAAAAHGHLTPLPSLELGTDPVISGVDSNVGFTRLYGSYISWRAPDLPVAREINPRMVYERLFSLGGDSGEVRRMASEIRLLDAVLEDATHMRRRLGRDDQFKLDEYLDSVRAVEKRLGFASSPESGKWRPEEMPHPPDPPAEGIPRDFREHVALMLDLLLLAFRTDSTRIATFMFANDVSGRNFSFIEGVHGGHHDMSHHENKADKLQQYALITRWHVEQYAGLLGRMKEIKEGEGTLLDNSMILFGSSISDGNSHNPNNLPLILGGRAGGALSTGQHIANPGNTPLCNLYMSMLHALDVHVDRFGDSTGLLESVLA